MKPEALSCAVEFVIYNQSMVLYGQADYYDRSSHFRTPMYFCKDCEMFYRQVNDPIRVDHCYAASYAQEQNEPVLYNARIHLTPGFLIIAKLK